MAIFGSANPTSPTSLKKKLATTGGLNQPQGGSTGSATTGPNLIQPSIDGDKQIGASVGVGTQQPGQIQSGVPQEASSGVSPTGTPQAFRDRLARIASGQDTQTRTPSPTDFAAGPPPPPGDQRTPLETELAGENGQPTGTGGGSVFGRHAKTVIERNREAERRTRPPTPGQRASDTSIEAILQRLVDEPTAFQGKVIEDLRDKFDREQNEQGRGARANFNTDAARRGIFHSGVPVAANERLIGQQARAKSDSDAGFAAQQAEATDRGRNAAAQLATALGNLNLNDKLGTGNLGIQQQGINNQSQGLVNQKTQDMMNFAISQLNAGKDVDPAIWQQIAESFRSSTGGSGTSGQPRQGGAQNA